MPNPNRLLSLLPLLLVTLACGPSESASTVLESNERWQPATVSEDHFRLGSFNIRNYPTLPFEASIDPETGEESLPPPPPLSYQRHTNDAALLDVLLKLNFDLLAVQEIVDPSLFEGLIGKLASRAGREYRVVLSDNDNDNPQHLGFVYDAERLDLLWTKEHPELDTSGRLRPGLSARFRGQGEDEIDFGAMVLHLASGSSKKRALLRGEQLAIAQGIIQDEIREYDDIDYMLLGDLNTARSDEELAQHDSLLETQTPLSRQENKLSCTSYWVKKASNPLLRPSALDHVYLSGFGERAIDVPLLSGTHCMQKRCETFESTDKASGLSFYDVSDHCPIYFEVKRASDDAGI